MKDFVILTDKTREGLEEQVREHLRERWFCVGGAQLSGSGKTGYWYISMQK